MPATAVRRRGAPLTRGRGGQAGQRGPGHPRPQGPQRRSSTRSGRPHHHQRRRDHRQGDRARGPLREPRRSTGQGGRDQDQRRGRRRHHHRHRPRPGPGPRGPAQRGRGANPMGLKRGMEKATEAVAEAMRNQAREIESQEIASVAAISARTPRSARPSPRPWTRSARTGWMPSTSRRPSTGARVHRGHAVRQGLHRPTSSPTRPHGGGDGGPLHPHRQLQDLLGPAAAAGAREGRPVQQRRWSSSPRTSTGGPGHLV